MVNPRKVNVLELVAGRSGQESPEVSQSTRLQKAFLTLVTPKVAGLILVGVVFLVLYMLAHPRSLGGDQIFNSPRENIGYLLSEQFAAGNGFQYPLAHYDELPPDIAKALTPRDAAEVGGNVVPKDFAGTMLVYAPFFVVWPPLVLFINPLFAVLGALVLWKLGEELFDWRVGVGAFVLWLAYPPMFINSTYIFTSDMIALFFSLSAMLLFTRYWRGGKTSDLLWMAAALGFATIMRYPNAIFIVVLGLALLQGRKLSLVNAALAALTLVPFAATILIFNRIVYGGFTVTGFHIGADLIAETANFSGESFLKFRPEVVAGYIKMYVLGWPAILAPQLLGVIVGGYVIWRRKDLRAPLIALMLISFLLTVYYLPQDAWGWTTPQVSASLLRYLLPALAIWTLLFVYGLLQSVKYPMAAAVVICGLVALYGWTSWSAPGGVQVTYNAIAKVRQTQDAVVANTEPDAIIATRIMDKGIFPERQTLTLLYVMDNAEPIKKGRLVTWKFLPDSERFADVGIRVYEAGIPIYLLADFDWHIAKEYDTALQERGYRLKNISRGKYEFKGMNFFQVVPLETSVTR